MKSKLFSIVLIVLLICAAAGSAYAVHEARGPLEPESVGTVASLTFTPKFISRRGFEVADGSIQPYVGVFLGPVSINAWSTYNVGDETGATQGNITETDWWVTYTKKFDKLTATGGYFFEAYAPNNTYELFLVLNYDTFLKPGVEVYWDPDEGDGGTFFFLTLSHSFKITDTLALDVNAWANYNNGNVLYGDFNEFYNGQIAASMSIPLTKGISIVPKIGYSTALSDESEAILQGGKSGKDEHFWAMVTLVASFWR